MTASSQNLRERIDELEEALRQAKTMIAPVGLVPRAWPLSHRETIVLSALIAAKGAYVSRDRLHFIMSNGERDTDPKIVDVVVHNLRRKLAGFGVSIETSYDQGRRLPPKDIATIAGANLEEWRAGMPAAIATLRALLAMAETAQAALDHPAASEPRA